MELRGNGLVSKQSGKERSEKASQGEAVGASRAWEGRTEADRPKLPSFKDTSILGKDEEERIEIPAAFLQQSHILRPGRRPSELPRPGLLLLLGPPLALLAPGGLGLDLSFFHSYFMQVAKFDQIMTTCTMVFILKLEGQERAQK